MSDGVMKEGTATSFLAHGRRLRHEDHQDTKTTKTLCDLGAFVIFVIGPFGRDKQRS
jgi:hypothetical protein